MALSIGETANATLKLLDSAQISISVEERERLYACGDAVIAGFRCKLANVLTLSSARVLVNTNWFRSVQPEYAKPRKKRGPNQPGIEYQLIPTNRKLFAVHYLDLRHYALFLEEDREQWFVQSYWGIKVNEATDSFVWSGNNTLNFPLLHLTSISILMSRNREIFDSMRSS